MLYNWSSHFVGVARSASDVHQFPKKSGISRFVREGEDAAAIPAAWSIPVTIRSWLPSCFEVLSGCHLIVLTTVVRYVLNKFGLSKGK
jgi:hypothetical protein